jgi:outer membrane protein insertion porin family
LESVSVSGNTKTAAYVILREMDLKPGMVLQKDTLKEDLRRIYNLNYFTELTPQFTRGKDPQNTRLQIVVKERSSSGSLSFGGGYSPTTGFSIFSDFYWDNLFGTGQLIMLKGQFGQATTYQFKYYNPWMWDNRKSFMLRTWLTDGSLGQISPFTGASELVAQRRKGIDGTVGIPLSYELKTFHKLKFEDVVLTNVNKAYEIESYTFSIAYDTRDIWFSPSEGDFHTFSVEKGFKLNDLSLDFTRYDLDLRKFFKVVDKQTIGTRFAVGYLTSPVSNDADIFGAEYYRAGGGDTVRGYDDQHPFAFGTKRILANLEYRFLFTDEFSFILFVDAGYATSNQDVTDWTRYKIGKGAGIRFNIPGLGPLRLDAGMDELGIVRMHFNIGNAF